MATHTATSGDAVATHTATSGGAVATHTATSSGAVATHTNKYFYVTVTHLRKEPADFIYYFPDGVCECKRFLSVYSDYNTQFFLEISKITSAFMSLRKTRDFVSVTS